MLREEYGAARQMFQDGVALLLEVNSQLGTCATGLKRRLQQEAATALSRAERLQMVQQQQPSAVAAANGMADEGNAEANKVCIIC